MSKLKGLFQKAWTAVTNPGQDERVELICNALQAGFQQQKQAFDLDRVIEPIECTTKDLEVASRRYYETVLERYWSKGVPTDSQAKMLAWVGNKLKLSKATMDAANLEASTVAFGVYLANALEDGVLSGEELDGLKQIARFVGLSLPVFVRRCWGQQALGILRSFFVQAIETGKLEPTMWDNLVRSAHSLGLSHEELLKSVRALGQSFAEHTLADAKSDDEITPQEERYIRWLLDALHLSGEFRAYVSHELNRVKTRMRLIEGHVPSLPVPPHVNLNAGELLHFAEPATLIVRKSTRQGEQFLTYPGAVFLTDNRVLFESHEKPVSHLYKSLIAFDSTDRYFRLQVKNKPEIVFQFAAPIENAGLLLTTLIRLHSQLLTKKVDGAPDRHIPRAVRQRVWQRYGGKCAECSATDYLEYDHIIPVAKGGSNGEQNVQLLCRRCNLQKSDNI